MIILCSQSAYNIYNTKLEALLYSLIIPSKPSKCQLRTENKTRTQHFFFKDFYSCVWMYAHLWNVCHVYVGCIQEASSNSWIPLELELEEVVSSGNQTWVLSIVNAIILDRAI